MRTFNRLNPSTHRRLPLFSKGAVKSGQARTGAVYGSAELAGWFEEVTPKANALIRKCCLIHLKEQLDLPATLVDLGDHKCREGEIVG